jgi:hypothetical protein
MLPALFVWLVLSMAAAKAHSEKQALIADTKCKQANKENGLNRQAG